MSADGDRRLGMIFGLIGAAFLVLAGLFDLVGSVVFLAVGHGLRALDALDQSIVFIVVGLLIGFFAVLGRVRGGDRTFVIGLILIVLALVGWLALGFGSGVLAILASIFVLIGGIFYLAAGR